MFKKILHWCARLNQWKKFLWATLTGWWTVLPGWQKLWWGFALTSVWTLVGMSPVLVGVYLTHSADFIARILNDWAVWLVGQPLPTLSGKRMFAIYYAGSWVFVFSRLMLGRYGYLAYRRFRRDRN